MGKNTFLLSQEGNVLRVAAYCRISTRHTDQFGSLKQQQAHFEKIIEANPDWKLVKIYSDTGSGLRTKNRASYRTMLRDGDKNRFDLVMMKLLSRLGRDTLETIRLIRR